MDPAFEQRLQLLIAKDEIRDVLMRYARGVDRGDADLISSCYHPDAVDDHGGVELTGADAGSLFASHRSASESGAVGQHFLGNITIEVEGNIAFTESYFVSYLIVDREGKEFTRFRGARYLDRFERRGGLWRIAYRVVVDDWDRIDPVVEQAPGRESWRRGAIRGDDPAAQFRAGPIATNEAAIRSRLGVDAATPVG